MLVIENVESKVILLKTLICREVKTFDKKPKEINVGIIDVDYSLIRYLGQATEINDININNCGYPIIKRKDNRTTTLGRFILEYYSKYDERLKEILENEDYEVNHINKNKLDNRIENLEIVTHEDNIKHSKGLEYSVIYTKEELKKLQVLNREEKQQETDRMYLNRISGLFYKALITAEIDNRLIKCCYLRFKYNKIKSNKNEQDIRESKKISILDKYKIMTNFYTNFIKLLLQKKKEFIYKTIVDNNITLLKRYIERYPTIEKILKKYKLIDKDFKEELKFDKSNSRNILLDFYEDISKSNQYIIDNGDILLNTTIKNSFNVRGKYKSFLILFYLGLLQRKKDISKTNTISNRLVHTPTFIKIPIYTDELLKEANNKAKDLLSLNLNKLSYFLVRQEFGEEIADSIYKNLKCKSYYRYGLRAKEDIINFIKTDKEVLNFGFMTVEEIFDYVQDLNIKRKIKGEDYNLIYNTFINFIKSLLLYNTDTKKRLENLGFVYISLNSKIIQNIKKYQKEQGFSLSVDLKPRKKVIVLKKLIK